MFPIVSSSNSTAFKQNNFQQKGVGNTLSSSDHRVEKVAHNIFVVINEAAFPSFEWLVRESIQLLSEKPTGKRLLDKIKESSVEVFISFLEGNKPSCCYSHHLKTFNNEFKKRTYINLTNDSITQSFSHYFNFIKTPLFIVIGHELIHAYHFAYDLQYIGQRFSDPRVWPSDEEYSAIVGFPRIISKPYPQITENNLRIEHGLHERYSYTGKLLQRPIIFRLIPIIIVPLKQENVSSCEIEINE